MTRKVTTIECSCTSRRHRVAVVTDDILNNDPVEWRSIDLEYSLQPSNFFKRVVEAVKHIVGYDQHGILGVVLLDKTGALRLLRALQEAYNEIFFEDFLIGTTYHTYTGDTSNSEKEE